MLIARLKSHVNIGNLIFAVSLVFVVWLVWYFYTGLGGSLQLAARLIPVALVLQILFMYQQGYLYKRLPPAVNHAIVVLYVAIAAYAFWYSGSTKGSRSTARARTRSTISSSACWCSCW